MVLPVNKPYRPYAHDVTGDYVIGLRHFEWQDGARCCVGVGCRGVCGCTNRHLKGSLAPV